MGGFHGYQFDLAKQKKKSFIYNSFENKNLFSFLSNFRIRITDKKLRYFFKLKKLFHQAYQAQFFHIILVLKQFFVIIHSTQDTNINNSNSINNITTTMSIPSTSTETSKLHYSKITISAFSGKNNMVRQMLTELQNIFCKRPLLSYI